MISSYAIISRMYPSSQPQKQQSSISLSDQYKELFSKFNENMIKQKIDSFKELLSK